MAASPTTIAFYDAVAEYYPLFYRDWEVQMEREGLSLRSIFRNRGIETVLDASCGAGAQAVPLAKLGFRVTGVDPSAVMLAKARDIAAQMGVTDRLTLVQGDFENLPQQVSGPFDAVITRGNSLPHLLTDDAIETAVLNFFDLLRPGGTVVIGMRDFTQFMEDRPRFLPGFAHEDRSGHEFISFDLWSWKDGPPVIATQSLFIIDGRAPSYQVIRRDVEYRPLSTDEVKVVLLEAGFEEVADMPDRAERVLVARKPLTLKQSPLWMKRAAT